MVPLGTLLEIKKVQGPSLISLYNLYPAATIIGQPAPGFSSGQAMDLMEQISEKTLPPGMGTDWTAMSYQEKIVGNQIYLRVRAGRAAGLLRAGRASTRAGSSR